MNVLAVDKQKVELFNRIEEQLLEKFGRTFPSTDDEIGDDEYLDRERLFNVLIKWIDFWISERPLLIKQTNVVLEMKKHICDARINRLLNESKVWNLEDDIKHHFREIIK